MKNCLRRGLGGAILFTFLFLCGGISTAAEPMTKTLAHDTKIMPPGFIVSTWSEIPKFKKGTVVTLTMYGEILEGILAEDANLPYESGAAQDPVKPTAMAYVPPPVIVVPTYTDTAPTNRVLRFKSGTKVIFNDRGEVISGTLTGSGQNIILNASNYISVTSGEIRFHKNGIPALCTLSTNSYLRPVGWLHILTDNVTDSMSCPGFVEFKSNNPVLLTEKGEVIKGTLNKDTKLRTLQTSLLLNSQVEIKVFAAETEVEFDVEGIASKTSK